MSPDDGSVIEPVENPEQSGETALAQAWVVKAWRLWLGGLRNWSAIAQEVGKDRVTVKKHVLRYGETIAELYMTRKPSAIGEYIDGLVTDLAFNMRVAVRAESGMTPTPEQVNAGMQPVEPDLKSAIAARKEVSARRRDIAEVLGIVGPLKGGIQASIIIGGSSGGASGSNGESGLTPKTIQFMLEREELSEDEFLALPEPEIIEGSPPEEDEPG